MGTALDEAPSLDTLLRDLALRPGGPDAEKCRAQIADTLLTPKWGPEHTWMVQDQAYVVCALTQALDARAALRHDAGDGPLAEHCNA